MIKTEIKHQLIGIVSYFRGLEGLLKSLKCNYSRYTLTTILDGAMQRGWCRHLLLIQNMIQHYCLMDN